MTQAVGVVSYSRGKEEDTRSRLTRAIAVEQSHKTGSVEAFPPSYSHYSNEFNSQTRGGNS